MRIPLGDVDAEANPVQPAAARVARLGIGGFPVETEQQRRDAAQVQLSILQREAEADPELAAAESHQREIKRASELAGGVPAKTVMSTGTEGEAPSAAAPAAPAVPTWDEVREMPEMKALPASQLERARNQYFEDVVLPQVPLGMAKEARSAFDADTKPKMLARAMGALSETVSRLRGARPGVDLSIESLDQLERSYRQLKQGANATGLVFDRRILNTFDAIDQGKKVPETDDVVGYQHMDAATRKAYRDRVQAGYVGALQSVAKEATEMAGLYQNPHAVEAIKAADNWQFRQAWDAFKKDPVGVVKDLSLSNAAQHVPMAVLGIAGKALRGIPGMLVGFAGGEFPVDYAMTLLDYLHDQKVDVSDYKAVDAKLREDGFVEKLANYASRHAAGVTVGDVVAGKFMKPIAGGLMRATGAAARNTALGIAGESGGEALGELAAAGKIQPGQVIAEGLAAGPMVVAGSTAQTVMRPTEAAAPAAPPAPVAAEEVLGQEERAAAAAPAAPATQVDEAAHEAATSPKNEKPEPTEAQREAGNHEMGHARINGMDVSIENPEGSKRREEWPELKDHYGYIRGTVGYDKEHLDVFVKPGTSPHFTGNVYVVNQQKADGSFDEHKAMLGYATEDEARDAYIENGGPDAAKRIGSVVPLSMQGFKDWAFLTRGNGPRKGELVMPATHYLDEKNVLHLVRQGEAVPAGAKMFTSFEAARTERIAQLKRDAAQRKKIDVDRDTITDAIIKLGGISDQYRTDTAGDDKTQKSLRGVGSLFTPKGVSPDEMVRLLAQHGYMTQAEIDDPRDTGGTRLMTDRIRAELMGKRKHSSIEARAISHDEEQRQREIAEDYERHLAALDAEEKAQAEAAAKTAAAAADDQWPQMTEAEREAELDRLFGPKAAPAEGKSGSEAARPAAAGPEVRPAEAAAKPAEREPGADDEGVAPPKPAAAPTSENQKLGAKNKIFTEDAAAKARELLKKKLGQINAGLDPEIIQAGLQLAGYYIEGGARTFSAYSKKMVADLGEAVRPYLKAWYLAIRNYPGFDNAGMQTEAELEALERENELRKPKKEKADAATKGEQPPGGERQHQGAHGERPAAKAGSGDRAPTGGEGGAAAEDVQRGGAGETGNQVARTIKRPLKAGDHVQFKDGFNKQVYEVWLVSPEGDKVKIDEPAPKVWRDVGEFKLAAGKEEGAVNEKTLRALGDKVAKALEDGETIDGKMLFGLAQLAFGGTMANNVYNVRDAYDGLELGVNLYVSKHADWYNPSADIAAARGAITSLVSLLARLPTQSRRTAETNEFQQFSTPPTLAYLIAWLGHPVKGETVLEPSAGTGDLAVMAMNAGAKVVANELAPRRAAALRALGVAAVHTENAEQLHNILPDTIKPTLVLMNPPFSSTAGRVEGQRDIANGIRHLDQAWLRLESGGRMVAIMGENFGRNPDAAKWLKKVRQTGEVRVNVSIAGKGYTKYGTTFGNQVIVLDKTGKPGESNPITGAYESPLEALNALKEVHDARRVSDQGVPASAQPSEPGAVESGSGETGTPAERPAARAEPPQSDLFAGGGGQAAARRENEGGGERAGAAPAGESQPENAAGGERGARGAGADGTAASARVGNDARVGDRGPAKVEGAQGAGNSVAVEATEAKPQGQFKGEVFENYSPPRLHIEGAKPHSTLLVESVAMRSVLPPAPTYKPNLPRETITSGGLSDAQLEAVVYAGQAHQDFLDTGSRRGFFIGDGTGVGKGREVAGIILDNWRQGRKQALWVTEKQKLYDDARRDIRGVGGDPDILKRHSGTKASEKIDFKNGVLFTTYATLRSAEKKQTADGGKAAGKTRVQQIVEWLGPDFEGVIAFDESHNMRQATDQKAARGKKKASQQALAGLELQRRLPKARVVYVSATGATEVSNLVYADRLGLWGPKTSFTDALKFVAEIDSAGVSAMELVARDLKQLGQYISRSLSFEGVTYDRITHELSEAQTAMYNRLAEAWQSVLQNIEAALGITGGDQSALAKAAAMSQFWGTHQRFFNQVITSMQIPSVLERVDKDLARGDAVVFQLVNTMEAAMDRALAEREEGEELEELDLTPRDQIIQYVKNSFPIYEFQQTTDENGTEVVQLVKDADGNPVVNKEALAMRDALMKDLQDIKVPDAPLDQIIRHLGTDKVAEITGRGLRVVPNKEGKLIEEKRGDSAVKADMRAFMDDKKPALVFSDAGGTGFSFHSDLGATNQRRRQHYLVQAGWRADKAVQGFGRTHRTNEVNQPNYILVATNLKAQRRFISSIARRLDQLGALTKGQRSASGQQMFSERDNLESVYAKRAVRKFLYGVLAGSYPDITFADVIEKQMGFRLRDPETGGMREGAIDNVSVPQFLNRLLSLSVSAQDKVFDAFSELMDDELEYAKATGTLDTGVKTLKAMKLVKTSEDVIHTDERTGAETKLVKLKATYPVDFITWKDADKYIPRAEGKENRVIGYFLSKHEKTEGRPYIVVQAGTKTDKSGAVLPRIKAISPVGVRYDVTEGDFTKEHAAKASKNALEDAWQPYIDKQPKTYDHTEHLISGMILPVWDRMHGQFVNVVQAVTDDGDRLIGRLISPHDVSRTLKAFGLSPIAKMTPTQIRDAVLGGDVVELANGWKLKKSTVGGEARIEVVPEWMSRDAAQAIKAYGGFVEVIQWKDRAFMPTDDLGKLAALLKDKPAADIKGAGRGEAPAMHRAYHGSPHDFDRFKLNKIDTGEGAQSFGWGLYFADRKEVAEYYRAAGTGGHPISAVDGVSVSELFGDDVGNVLTLDSMDVPDEGFSGEDARKALLAAADTGLRHAVGEDRAALEQARVRIAKADASLLDISYPKGKLYEVELAPAEDEYLQWDKPLTEQSAKVRAALRRIPFATYADDSWNGAQFYAELAKDMGGPLGSKHPRWMRDMGITAPSEEAASKALLAAGIPGIKYSDAGSRRTQLQQENAELDVSLAEKELEAARGHGAGPEKIAEVERALERLRERARQSHNYVIFDDSLVKIEAKYRRSASTGGMDAGAVRELAASITKAWSNAPKVEVVDSPADLPFEAPDDALGAFHRGKVYLVASNISSEKDAQFTLFHETLGHYGLRQFFGKELDPVLRDISARNGNVRRVATKWMAQNPKPKDWSNEDHRLQAIEEALADLAGSGAKLNGVGRLLAAVQRWLRAHGLGQVADWLESLSDAEALSVLARARDYVTAGAAAEEGTTAPAFFSRGAIEERPAARRESLFNAATRIPTQLLGIDKLTSWAYDNLIIKLGGMLTPEAVKAGIGHDYGIPEAVSDRRDLMYAHQRKQLREVSGVLGKLLNLTRAESRVAYAWMNDRDGDALLEQLPEESRQVLRDMKARVDELSKEAIRLGQLSVEAYERNKMAYLHRSYRKYELDASKQDRAARGRAVRILGDQYKGRGMVDAAAMAKIKAAAPAWWGRKLREGKGDRGLINQMFVRLERRRNRGEGTATLEGVEPADQRGRLQEVAYWPASEPVPDRYKGWTRDAGEWKVTGTKGDKLIMWRDFTAEERQRMGEIDEVRFAIAKTMQQMVHDTEAGKYLEWLANQHSRNDENLPRDAKVVEARESLFRTFGKDEWVRVPDATIGGTQTKKYGKLAGLYIPGPIWNDVRQVVNHRYTPLGETYNTMLRAWKVSKTALSPAVHMNNVMANVVMADWHDILAGDLVRALRIMVSSEKAENKALLAAFEDNGGTQGMYALAELQREQLQPLVDALEREVAQAEDARMLNAAGVLQALLAGKYREAASAAAGGKVARAGKAVANAMIDLYQAEDTVFRLAAFLKAKAEGQSDAEAGKVARRSFLDYSINAPWIQMMRATVFPFISFVYRAAPMMLETYARKPWKLMKLWIVLGGLNALGYMFSGGDEDKERRLLPKEKQGRVLGVLSPKLVRMPWNDQHGSPVFLDVRRFIPVGDVFDLGQTHAALPWTPVAVPGGPLAVALELYSNRSQFTGKEITHGSDTAREVAVKVFDHVYKAVAPNLPFLPGTYSFKDIAEAGSGKTDAFGREKSMPQALGSSVGIKVGGYPADVAKLGIKIELDAAQKEIRGEIFRLAREYARKGITKQEFDDKRNYQVEKLKTVEKEAAERLR